MLQTDALNRLPRRRKERLMQRQSTSKPAFTLVELLVVIALIVVLIALLLPVVIAVKRRAQEVACASNLRQLGMAMTMYTQDHRFFPGVSFPVPGGGLAEGWPVRLRKYLQGNQKVFYCPSQDSRCQWVPDSPGKVVFAQAIHAQFGYEPGERLLLWSEGTWFSYAYNGMGAQGGPGYPSPRGMGSLTYENPDAPKISIDGGRLATSMKRPSEFIMIADTTANGVNDFALWPFNTSSEPGFETVIGNIHRRGANVLFGDGHVGWHLQSELTTKWPPVPQDAAKQRLWNLDHEPARLW